MILVKTWILKNHIIFMLLSLVNFGDQMLFLTKVVKVPDMMFQQKTWLWTFRSSLTCGSLNRSAGRANFVKPIKRDGTVTISERLSMKMQCVYDFKYFPMDNQVES